MLKNLYGQKRVKRTQQELNAILTAHERYVSYQGGVRAQLTHADLAGLNLANRILKEAELSGASLVGATLYGSNLERASLYCADLRGCNLQAADLRRADLRGASLKGAVLSYAMLDGADMRSAMMMYVGPGGVSLLDHNNAAGNGQDEDGVNTATGVDFSNCSLKHASFGSAKLDNVNFGGALLEGAKFKGAVLTGVDLKELDVPAHALDGCVTDPTPEALAKALSLKDALAGHQEWVTSGGKAGGPASLDGQDLRPLKGDLKARVLAALSARRTNAIGVDFSGCQLQAAKFDGADLRDCDFSDADLRGASFKGTSLAHAHFHGANLGGLPMASGTALNPDFSGSDAIAEQFIGAQLDAPLADLGLPACF